ncbi:Contactin-associated protein like 5-3 [Halotydeus destructor]|nr:Contactin-associated protein like 5-3 [Halotydeus destructor]
MSTRLICRYLVVSALVVALHRQLIVASDTGGDTGVTLDPGPQFYGQGQPQQCVNGTRTFCQHGGRCVLDHVGRASCDCAGTGYTGRACHFAIYKQSCQELYLSGHRESGNYVIDVDRNGPCPPARVVCHMDKEHIKTTIVHNVPNELVVRSKQMNGFYLNVTYRDFDDDMIKRLISNSRKCYQTVRYECRGVPLGLSSITWFRTTGNTRMFDFGGSALGSCTCSDTQSCSGRKWCNCDNIRPNDWQVDSGNVTDPAHLAIGQLHFLRPSGLRPESEGRFWLGPLECLDIPSEEQAITFKTLDSRLLLDHQWPFGHLAFSFRTVQERSVILHQHCSRNGSSHGHLIIAVMGSNEIEFTYKVDGNTRSTRLMTPGPLNDGQWQVVRVDHDDHHMRFTVNLVDFMIDLPVVGMFDGLAGPLTIGGSGLTDTCLDNGPLSGSAAMPGFRGCFRGLSVDDSRVDMYQHLASRGVTIAEDELETGCKSSCTIDHHPCQNGATCVEQWGSFECLCSNPVAQSGKLCEINLNGNSVTFASARAFLHIMHSPINSSNERTVNYGKLMNLFTGDIQVAFRTQSRRALIFYANDHLNNFVQLIVDQGRQIGFTFNVDNQLITMLLDLEGDLDDGQLVQLAIERNETTISMTANGRNVISHHQTKLLTNYTQHPWTLSDRHLEQVRPPRPEVGPDDYVQLFVGGVDGLRGKTSVPTLIGCIMGLIVAGQQVDIMKEAETMKSPLLQTGCEQLCKGDTCGHGGHCSDRWSPKGTVCTCEDTSYRGHDCRQDIGAKFDGHSVVRLVLPHLSVPVQECESGLCF